MRRNGNTQTVDEFYRLKLPFVVSIGTTTPLQILAVFGEIYDFRGHTDSRWSYYMGQYYFKTEEDALLVKMLFG